MTHGHGQALSPADLFGVKVPFGAPIGHFYKYAGAYADEDQMHSLSASLAAVYLPFFVFEREITRLD
jgi:hypothetical protein